jgi:uncharacterized protein DUF4349
MRPSKSLSTLLVVAFVGCSEQQPFDAQATGTKIITRSAGISQEQTKVAAPAATPSAPARAEMTLTDGSVTMLATATQPGAAGATAGPSAISRKIIYDAQVDVIVESVDPIAKRVTTLVQDARGYIAEQNVTGSPGSLRSMRWKIRIPVEQFDSFVESVVSLGELERNNRTSQDVSDQYYDIEARIKNKRVEEQTLNKILQERSGKLEDVLKIEIELSRVRGEIEQLEGKIRVLENLSSLATLTLNVREREKYAPSAPVVASFGTQISRTWDSSMLSLVNLGKAIVLWTVSWAIWLPFLFVGAIVAWVLGRKLIRIFIRSIPRLVALLRAPLTGPRAPSARAE